VLFDIGGVLLAWEDEWLFGRIARELRTSRARAGRAVLRHRPALQSGRIDLSTFWHRVARDCGTERPRSWRRLWATDLERRGRIDRRVMAIARRLRQEGHCVGVLSNTDPSHVRFFDRRGWFRGLSPRLYSFDLGEVKPAAGAFRTARALSRVPAREILFIDDTAANVAAARRAGWNAIRFRSARQLAARLAKVRWA
jgi:FMN phosphatase YigB (HAD superfamily)